jgi:hypothetical protein
VISILPCWELSASCPAHSAVTALTEIHQEITSSCTSVSVVSEYRLGDRGSIPGRGKGFSSNPVSRPALRSTQPHIPMGTRGRYLRVKFGQGMTLTASSPLMPSWHEAWKLYFTLGKWAYQCKKVTCPIPSESVHQNHGMNSCDQFWASAWLLFEFCHLSAHCGTC